MNDAELYHESNSLQKRDAVQCLEEYAWKMKWKKYGGKIIDIGCGDGSVTTGILKKYIPYNVKKLVGCDISEQMIRFANDRYSDEHTTFSLLDISSQIPKEFFEGFHHAFSFYTLHWIKNQKAAFKNIYDLLKPGGDCLLMFLGHMPIYDVYQILSRSNKWSYWLQNVETFISPYHQCEDSESKIRNIMDSVGFKDIQIKCEEKSFVFDNLDAVKKAVKAINPFKIPGELFDDFMEDYLEVVREMHLIDKVNNNIDKIIKIPTTYTLIIIHATKSL